MIIAKDDLFWGVIDVQASCKHFEASSNATLYLATLNINRRSTVILNAIRYDSRTPIPIYMSLSLISSSSITSDWNVSSHL